ncbi:MAG TPA: MBOAT family protein [Desulfitobacterium dehalogenans]|uniref:MBOAT family protein n=1 Tax=Desulfitobacterium dehalogenans TaxID=36854 RepID=A0A7C6Z527_9FIRM|nr:MBOAT family protein [Desulfitobacterium dehalogenans]
MLFSSISFLYVFLPIVLLSYFLVPYGVKNVVLLGASLIFYFAGEPIFTVLLIISTLSAYLHGLYIEAHRGLRRAKAALASSILINLGILGFFKYADFFIANWNGLTGGEISLLQIALPLGISFYTFQTMSYAIDVYRGEVKAERSLVNLATYVSLFPQLVAGPIVRYSTVAEDLRRRTHGMTDIALGIRRFVIGLAKKVIIANSMGELCAVFQLSDEKSVLFYWIYALAFTLQIYFDFSGYSDMAIGLSRIFGFRFPENFNYPYISRSITEFWRRWHISLSSWFRDYIYIPLGGNRVSLGKWVRNILIVWFLTGFWHGAEWNFILWGLLFGLLLLMEKLFLNRFLEKLPNGFRRVYTMFFIVCSFVLFNATGLSGALQDFQGMFGVLPLPLWNEVTLYYLKDYAFLLVISLVGTTPWLKNLLVKAQSRSKGAAAAALLWAEPIVLTGLLLLVSAYLVDGSFNPFLYFRF